MADWDVKPIWKDCVVTLGTGDSADYEIKCNGAVIYQGRAYKKPGAANVAVKINDVCADYLRSDWPGLASGFYDNGFAALFTVETEGTEVARITFYNSYEHGVTGWFPGYLEWPTLVRKEVAVGAAAMSINGPETDTGLYYQWVIPVTSIEQEISGLKVTDCARFVLYYTDRFGQWVWMNARGTVKYRENYSRTQAKREYDNGNPEARGTFDIVNEVRPEWDINTGWLTDAEAARMGHLLGTTRAMLLDIEKGEAVPVTIVNNSYEEKTYNQERKLINYTITLALAQERIRR